MSELSWLEKKLVKWAVKESPKSVVWRKLYDPMGARRMLFGLAKRNKKANQGKEYAPGDKLKTRRKGANNFYSDMVYSFYRIEKDHLSRKDQEAFDNNEIRIPLMGLYKKRYECETILEELVSANKEIHQMGKIKEPLFDEKISDYILHNIRLAENKQKTKGTENRFFDNRIDNELRYKKQVNDGFKTLVENILGRGMYNVYAYANEVYSEFEGKRAIENYYMVHPLRVTYRAIDIVQEQNIPDERFKANYKNVMVAAALLHDIPESANNDREEKLENLILDIDAGTKPTDDTLDEIIRLKEEIENPPELNKIEEVTKNLGGIYEPNSERIMKAVKLLSKTGDDYSRYIGEMYKGVEGFFGDKNMKGYEVVAPMIKLLDSIDNTNTLMGLGESKWSNRIKRNETVIAETKNFMRLFEEKIKEENNIKYKEIYRTQYDTLAESVSTLSLLTQNSKNKFTNEFGKFYDENNAWIQEEIGDLDVDDFRILAGKERFNEIFQYARSNVKKKAKKLIGKVTSEKDVYTFLMKRSDIGQKIEKTVGTRFAGISALSRIKSTYDKAKKRSNKKRDKIISNISDQESLYEQKDKIVKLKEDYANVADKIDEHTISGLGDLYSKKFVQDYIGVIEENNYEKKLDKILAITDRSLEEGKKNYDLLVAGELTHAIYDTADKKAYSSNNRLKRLKNNISLVRKIKGYDFGREEKGYIDHSIKDIINISISIAEKEKDRLNRYVSEIDTGTNRSDYGKDRPLEKMLAKEDKFSLNIGVEHFNDVIEELKYLKRPKIFRIRKKSIYTLVA